MPINPAAEGTTAPPVEHEWDSRDALIYALGVGAGSLDPGFELEFTTENSAGVPQRVLPTFAVIAGQSGARRPAKAGPATPLAELGTFGCAGRALLHTLCGSDPVRFSSMGARFSRPVYPGDTLSTSMWVDGNEAVFRTETQDGVVVLDGGRMRFA